MWGNQPGRVISQPGAPAGGQVHPPPGGSGHGYGAPPPSQANLYGAPPPQQAPHGAGYGAPPPHGAGYGPPHGAPPPQQAPQGARYRPPHGAPPPQQAPHGAGYGPPHGAPPPQQAPHGAGYGPPHGAPPPQQGYGPPRGYGQPGAPPPQGAAPSAPGYGQAPPSHGHGPPPTAPGYGSAYNPGPVAPGYNPGTGPPNQHFGGSGNAPPPGVTQELWGWFQAVDQDRSGKITANELQQALMNGNYSPFNPETCRLMIGMFDGNRDGTINVQEFAALWKYIQDWKGCFDRFDTDRSGNINASELQNAFQTFGYNLSPQFCHLCVRLHDRQNAHAMKFDDFIQCCVMLKSLTDQFRQKDVQQRGEISLSYEDFLRMVLDNAMVK